MKPCLKPELSFDEGFVGYIAVDFCGDMCNIIIVELWSLSNWEWFIFIYIIEYIFRILSLVG